MVTQVFGIRFSVSFLPPCNKLLLSLFSACKVLWVGCFLEWMPIVKNPIRWNHFPSIGTSSRTIRNCKLIVSQFMFMIKHLRNNYIFWVDNAWFQIAPSRLLLTTLKLFSCH